MLRQLQNVGLSSYISDLTFGITILSLLTLSNSIQRYETQHNDIQNNNCMHRIIHHKDTHHNDNQHNYNQYNDSKNNNIQHVF